MQYAKFLGIKVIYVSNHPLPLADINLSINDFLSGDQREQLKLESIDGVIDILGSFSIYDVLYTYLESGVNIACLQNCSQYKEQYRQLGIILKHFMIRPSHKIFRETIKYFINNPISTNNYEIIPFKKIPMAFQEMEKRTGRRFVVDMTISQDK